MSALGIIGRTILTLVLGFGALVTCRTSPVFGAPKDAHTFAQVMSLVLAVCAGLSWL